jgi:5-methylcytosine-specific restriction endonuclease McrA
VNRRGRRNRRRQERWAGLWGYWGYQRKIRVWLARRGLAGLWEADHVVPVVEGGGLAPPEGYRILCVPCHRAETAALAGRRAEARRPPKRTPTHHQTNLLEI